MSPRGDSECRERLARTRRVRSTDGRAPWQCERVGVMPVVPAPRSARQDAQGLHLYRASCGAAICINGHNEPGVGAGEYTLV
jgi:hypothetical protein